MCFLLIFLTVGPPTVLDISEHQYMVEGERCEITCSAMGYPRPDITWYKGDLQLENTPTLKIAQDFILVRKKLVLD